MYDFFTINPSLLNCLRIHGCHLAIVIISYISWHNSWCEILQSAVGTVWEETFWWRAGVRDQIYETHLKPRKMFIKLPASSQ